jgi:hypothetical protein
MLRCVNDGVRSTEPEHQTTGNACVLRSDEPFFTQFPTSGGVYVWRTPKEAYNPGCLVPTIKHGGGSVMLLGSNIVVQYYVGPIITLDGRITAKENVDRLGNQVHPSHEPDVISEQRCSYPRRQCPHLHSSNCSVMV